MSFIGVFKTINDPLKKKHFYVMIFIMGVYRLVYEHIVRTQIISQMLVLQDHHFPDGEHAKVIQI